MAKVNPLQEQLLKAGLVKKSKVAAVAREQNKARHAKGTPQPSEVQLEAERARAEALVEGDRRGVPVEHLPHEAIAPLADGRARERDAPRPAAHDADRCGPAAHSAPRAPEREGDAACAAPGRVVRPPRMSQPSPCEASLFW